jgi:hypothetical protein
VGIWRKKGRGRSGASGEKFKFEPACEVCFLAGVWRKRARGTGGASGKPLYTKIRFHEIVSLVEKMPDGTIGIVRLVGQPTKLGHAFNLVKEIRS